MSTLTVDVQQRQRTTEFRLFGPDIVIHDGEPVAVPLGGPRELLTLMLLSPEREATYEQISSAMGRRVRMKEAHRFHDELSRTLEGTDISILPFNKNMVRRVSNWSRLSLANAGFGIEGSINVDLDRSGRPCRWRSRGSPNFVRKHGRRTLALALPGRRRRR